VWRAAAIGSRLFDGRFPRLGRRDALPIAETDGDRKADSQVEAHAERQRRADPDAHPRRAR